MFGDISHYNISYDDKDNKSKEVEIFYFYDHKGRW